MKAWFRLLFGPGYGCWPCNVVSKDHHCDKLPHDDYKHRCACGFRWAA